MSLLLAEALSKRFTTLDGPLWALQSFSLDVEPGSRWAIVGPNGAGKSTFLRLAAGVLAPTTGRIHRTRRCSALIELAMGFHPDLTGRENLDLGLTLAGLSRADRRKVFGRAVEFAGLTHALDQPLRHYSTGMVARLSCSVAVHTKPDLLLIDEVLAVGDTSFQRQMLTTIEELVGEGAALVLVTHSPELAEMAADRAVWISNGRESLRGPVQDVLDAYEVDMRGLAATARDIPVRIERLTVEPCTPDPGGAISVRTIVRAEAEVEALSIVAEIRPVTGSDSWMRPDDEPRAHRLLNLIGTTTPQPVGVLRPGRHTLQLDVQRIPVTPTLLELTVVLTHDSRGIVDEVSTEIRIGDTPPARPQYLLDASYAPRGPLRARVETQ